MNKMWYKTLSGTLVAAMIGLGTAGCDDDADTSSAENITYSSYGSHTATKTSAISVTPTSSEVTFAGQKFSFRAVGGTSPYTWAVGNSTQGAVTSGGSDGSYGVYTASQVGPNTVIVYDKTKKAAVATITGTEISLNITEATLETDGDKVALKVSGGVSPYVWKVGDTTLGQVSASTGSTTVYERYHSGDNSVSVTDSRGNVAYAVIKQP